MEREQIIRMAIEAGCIEPAIPDWVIRTCALVASAEREACAKLCVDLWKDDYSAYACAVAIKERGQA